MVALGAGATCGVRGLSAAFASQIRGDARQWIGGDLAVNVNDPLNDDERAAVEGLARAGVRVATLAWSIVAASSDRAADPAAIVVKVVDPRVYPLYGGFDLDTGGELRGVLAPDAAAVSPDLLERLGLRPGDWFRIRDARFRAAAVVRREPDRWAHAPTPFPRVILSHEAFERTGIARAGNVMTHALVFALPPGADVDALRRRVAEILPHGDMVDYRHPEPVVAGGLEAAVTFLHLTGWLALVLGSVAVAVTTRLHLERRRDDVAILKILGARHSSVAAIYAIETAMLALAGGVAGLPLGGLVHRLGVESLRRDLPASARFQWQWSIAGESVALAVLLSLAMTIPALSVLPRYRPSAILRRDPPAMRAGGRAILAAIAPAVVAGAAAAWLTESWRIAAVFLFGLTAGVSLLWTSARVVPRLAARIPTRRPAWRHGLRGVRSPEHHPEATLVALSIGVMMLSAAWFGQRATGAAVARSLPWPGADLVAFYAAAEQVEGLRKLLGEIEPRTAVHSSPIAWMRVATAAGARVDRSIPVTCESSVPPGGLVLSTLRAAEMDASSGDAVEFQARTGTIRARVTALRSMSTSENFLRGATLHCGALSGMNLIHHATIRLNGGRVEEARRAIAARFPGVGLASLGEIEDAIRGIAGRAMTLVRALGWLVVAAGAAILAAVVAASRDARAREIATLKALGAHRRWLLHAALVEFGAFGLAAGVIGTALGAAFASLMLSAALHQPAIAFAMGPAAAAVSATAVIASAAGWLASRGVLRRRPLESLRDE